MSLIDNLDNLKDNLKDNLWVYHTPLSIFLSIFQSVICKKAVIITAFYFGSMVRCVPRTF